MFHDPPPLEASAWHEGSDEDWARYAAAVHAAAVKRGEDDGTEGDDSAG